MKSISDPAIFTRLQTNKGEILIASSAGLIFILLGNEIRCRDVVEHSWRQRESKYQQLIEQVSDGIFLSDEMGCCIDVYPSGCEKLGYTRDELLGMSLPICCQKLN